MDRLRSYTGKLIGPWVIAYAIIFGLGVFLYLRYLDAPIPDNFRSMLNAYESYYSSGHVYKISDPLGFRLAPVFLVFIGLLPSSHQLAWEVFVSISILSLMTALVLGARYRTYREVIFLISGLWLSWSGIKSCLESGQVECLCLLLTIVSCVLFTRYTVAAGLIAGILPWIRLPYFVLSCAFLLAASRRGRVVGRLASTAMPASERTKNFFSGMFFGSIISGALLPAMMFGPEKTLALTQDWIDVLKAQPYLLIGDPLNQSLWVSLGHVFSSYPDLSTGIGAVIGGWLVGAMLVRRPYAPSSQDAFSWVSPWLLLIHLLNPVSFQWAQVSLVGLTFSVFRTGRRILTLRLALYLCAAILAFAIGRGLEAIYHVSMVTLLQVLLLLLSV